jgi:hypothetical protein
MSHEKENILAIRTTIVSDMKRFMENMSDAPAYLPRLLKFLSSLSAIASEETEAEFTGKDFTIIPKFKNDEG